jgi:serine/threonine-protein kinase RsbW
VHASVRLAPVPESAAKARTFVAQTLHDWGCREVVDDARLVVTELVSNVVRHAGTDLALDVDLDEVRDRVRIDVVDHSDGEVAVPVGNPTLGLGGRGLRLVEQLSERWGVERQRNGKCVWAEWRVGRRSRDEAHTTNV